MFATSFCSVMANIEVEIAGLKFRNPVLTAAGPMARSGDVLLEASKSGVGGLVAKTVSRRPAEVPRPNMTAIQKGHVGSRRGILNAELWSELPLERWLEQEYRKALNSGLPLIASLGYTPEEVAEIAPKIERAGAHALEFSTHYVGGHTEIAKVLRESVEIPIFAKLSPQVDVARVAKSLDPYVDGIVGINTYGPCLRIDIETAKPMLGSNGGYGWMSGAALKPIAMRCVADIALAINKPIIAVGGVTDGSDAIEFVMAGASAVEVCTAAILDGPGVYGRIAREMKEWLTAHGYDSIEDIRGIALKGLKGHISMDRPPVVDDELCTLCGLCPKSCVYGAIELNRDEKRLIIHEEACERCGLCISVCPYHALSSN